MKELTNEELIQKVTRLALRTSWPEDATIIQEAASRLSTQEQEVEAAFKAGWEAFGDRDDYEAAWAKFRASLSKSKEEVGG